MDNSTKHKIDTIKSILRSIMSSNPKDIDFMFVVTDKNNVNNIDYLYKVNNSESPNSFHLISEISNQDFQVQQKYRHDIDFNTGHIVYCLNNENLEPNVFPLVKGKLYKVIDVYKSEGVVYYNLENTHNDNVDDFKGYESKRFTRIVSKNSFN